MKCDIETTKYCHKCGQAQAMPDSLESAAVQQLTVFNENKLFSDLGQCMADICKADCFGAGNGENASTMLSPWCPNCGDGDDDERTVTTKWQAIRNRPEVLCLQLKRFNQVWDDFRGMVQVRAAP